MLGHSNIWDWPVPLVLVSGYIIYIRIVIGAIIGSQGKLPPDQYEGRPARAQIDGKAPFHSGVHCLTATDKIQDKIKHKKKAKKAKRRHKIRGNVDTGSSLASSSSQSSSSSSSASDRSQGDDTSSTSDSEDSDKPTEKKRRTDHGNQNFNIPRITYHRQVRPVYMNQGHQPKEMYHEAKKPSFKRVDRVWNRQRLVWELQDTEGDVGPQSSEICFHVRRMFDTTGRYCSTVVEINSKPLRDCVQSVMRNVQNIVEHSPTFDANTLFLYVEDLRKLSHELTEIRATGKGKPLRKKKAESNQVKRQHLKVLIRYLNKDFTALNETLYKMLESGLIVFRHVWALWKPGTLAFTSTYSSPDQPRVFLVEAAEKHRNDIRGEFYHIKGKFLDYDGKQHGFASVVCEIAHFHGSRKITSLEVYPLQYHEKESQMRKELIERGKKFMALGGMHHRSYQGVAYFRGNPEVTKVDINGRIMIDPRSYRRIKPNYPVSMVLSEDLDVFVADQKEVIRPIRVGTLRDEREAEKFDEVAPKSERDAVQDGRIPALAREKEEGQALLHFGDEEYLIASPVVLGFAFVANRWLEFAVSSVEEIRWNEETYDSLVLESGTKDIVKTLVESNTCPTSESIGDVIQGKGKGLIALLHGPPGTGKTLTVEGMSEHIKCPLYMISAAELDTNTPGLESQLEEIFDICHAWRAILLLDEADIYLKQRTTMEDFRSNRHIEIFLRKLEYFQGILFLTTNRVETFDHAFQSRIHIALPYEDLKQSTRKAIFQMFLERIRVLRQSDLMPCTDEDLDALARHELNGWQIKNVIRTAQALAMGEGKPLAISHMKQTLGILLSFDNKLKGGTGYQDAMRSYV